MAQTVDFAVGQHEEELVGRRVDVGAISLPEQRLPEAAGRRDGLPRDTQIESVGEERLELEAQQPTLGQQGAVLLDEGEEVGQQSRVATTASPKSRPVFVPPM